MPSNLWNYGLDLILYDVDIDKNLPLFEYFEQFLAGEMEEEERISFLEKMKSDPTLAEKFELFKTSRQLVKSYELGQWEKSIRGFDYVGLESKWRAQKMVWMGLGALVVSLALWGWFTLSPSHTQPGSTAKQPKIHTEVHAETKSESIVSEVVSAPTPINSTKQETKPKTQAVPEQPIAVSPTPSNERTEAVPNQAPSIVQNPSSKVEQRLEEKAAVATAVTAQLDVVQACPHMANGKIILSHIQSKGAITVLVNQKVIYHGQNQRLEIPSLESGQYEVTVKDDGGSLPFSSSISVGIAYSKNCVEAIKGVVHTANQQPWVLEAASYGRMVRIQSLAGTAVLEKKIPTKEGWEWDGKNAQGEILPMGTYFVEIYDEQHRLVGKGEVGIIGQ